jgi:hypothetical protein
MHRSIYVIVERVETEQQGKYLVSTFIIVYHKSFKECKRKISIQLVFYTVGKDEENEIEHT